MKVRLGIAIVPTFYRVTLSTNKKPGEGGNLKTSITLTFLQNFLNNHIMFVCKIGLVAPLHDRVTYLW